MTELKPLNPLGPKGLSRLAEETFPANQVEIDQSRRRKKAELPANFYIGKSGSEFPATDRGYADMKADNSAFWNSRKKLKTPIK